MLALPGDVPTIDQKMIDPANLPIDPATCKPVYPHQYLKVNTIFEVAHAAGLRTAWTDKHAAYEIINGHPRAASTTCSPPRSTAPRPTRAAGRPGPGLDDEQPGHPVLRRDQGRAVLNEIDGFDHGGTRTSRLPASSA